MFYHSLNKTKVNDCSVMYGSLGTWTIALENYQMWILRARILGCDFLLQWMRIIHLPFMFLSLEPLSETKGRVSCAGAEFQFWLGKVSGGSGCSSILMNSWTEEPGRNTTQGVWKLQLYFNSYHFRNYLKTASKELSHTLIL